MGSLGPKVPTGWDPEGETRMMSGPRKYSVVARTHNIERRVCRHHSGIPRLRIGNLRPVPGDLGSPDTTFAMASRYPVRVLAMRPEEFSFGQALKLSCGAERKSALVSLTRALAVELAQAGSGQREMANGRGHRTEGGDRAVKRTPETPARQTSIRRIGNPNVVAQTYLSSRTQNPFSSSPDIS